MIYNKFLIDQFFFKIVPFKNNSPLVNPILVVPSRPQALEKVWSCLPQTLKYHHTTAITAAAANHSQDITMAFVIGSEILSSSKKLEVIGSCASKPRQNVLAVLAAQAT